MTIELRDGRIYVTGPVPTRSLRHLSRLAASLLGVPESRIVAGGEPGYTMILEAK